MAVTQVIKTLGNVLEGMKTIIDSWLSTNITNPSSPPLDRSLSLANAAAPADLVGDLKTKINTIDNKAPVIIESVSGDIVSFDDGAEDMPLKKCLIQIEPVQDLNGQEYPYPAGGGKNLLPFAIPDTINGVSFAVSDTGAVTVSGTATGNAGFDIGRNNTILPAGTYYVSTHNTTTNVTYTLFKIVSGTASVLRTGAGFFTLTEETSVFMRMSVQSGNTASGVAYPMIERGTAASSYAPYSNICPITGWTGGNITLSPSDDPDDPDKTVYPITWQTEAGTVYGGTFDPTTGILTVDRVLVDMGTLNWQVTGDRFAVWTRLVPNPISNSSWNVDNPIGISSIYPYGNVTNGNGIDKVFGFYNGLLYARDTAYDNPSDFKTSLSNSQLVYKVATPFTYYLTPEEIKTLFQNNSIWSDIGPISVDYCADTKTYIDNKITEIVNG